MLLAISSSCLVQLLFLFVISVAYIKARLTKRRVLKTKWPLWLIRETEWVKTREGRRGRQTDREEQRQRQANKGGVKTTEGRRGRQADGEEQRQRQANKGGAKTREGRKGGQTDSEEQRQRQANKGGAGITICFILGTETDCVRVIFMNFGPYSSHWINPIIMLTHRHITSLQKLNKVCIMLTHRHITSVQKHMRRRYSSEYSQKDWLKGLHRHTSIRIGNQLGANRWADRVVCR